MDGRLSPFHVSVPLGTWFATHVRVSVWFPLLALILWWRFGLQLGLLLTLILFVSVLIHEFFHVFAARRTGGSADEILMWPAGGLAFARPANSFRSEFLTPAAGPFANLLLCAVTFRWAWLAGFPAGTFHPVYTPEVGLADQIWSDIALLTFDVNWSLLLLNLLPVYPLDGGQMLLSVIARRVDRETARFASLRIGMGVGLVAAIIGLMIDDGAWLVFIGFLVFSMDMYEFFMIQLSDQFDDSFMGYDFSQGYTSLERSQQRAREKPPGAIERWRKKRAEQRRQQEEQERVETERKLDELLDKVHREGMDALTDAEKRFLQKASTRYRSQDRPS
jgi:Zn-dependent protease